MGFSAFGNTHVGMRREHNEDSFCIDLEHQLFVVADGMGGHAAGEVASDVAVTEMVGMITREYEKVKEGKDNPEVIARLIEASIQSATYMVYGMAEQAPEKHGMGTTLSVMIVAHDNAYIGQVGDSRIYLFRNNRCQQITEDHTFIQEQIKAGVLTPEEARNSRYGNLITRAVGVKEYVQVDTQKIATQPGDRFLICSDGLSEYFKIEEELSPYLMIKDPNESVRAMIERANELGGKDNITAILVDRD